MHGAHLLIGNLRQELIEKIPDVLNPKYLLVDKGILYVAGQDAKDRNAGRIRGALLKRTTMGITRWLRFSIKTQSPILSGVVWRGKIYFGSAGGDISVFNILQKSLERTIAAAPGRVDISHMVTGKGNDLFMAFRRTDGNGNDWCYQEYFQLPEVRGVKDQFTGHHPGPCTSLMVYEDNLFWTDSGWRGRWANAHKALPQLPIMWDNGKIVSNAIIMGSSKPTQYILSANGKVDAFDMAGFDNDAPPEPAILISLPAGEVTSGRWGVLIADPSRQVIWVANDEGCLVELPADLSETRSVPYLPNDGYSFDGGGVIGPDGELILADSSDATLSKLLFLKFSSECLLGKDLKCSCRIDEDSATPTTICLLHDTLTVVKEFNLPPNMIIESYHDIVLSPGATLSVSLGSFIRLHGCTFHLGDANLKVDDLRNQPQLLKGFEFVKSTGSVTGSFGDAYVSQSMVFARLFACFQLPQFALEIHDDKIIYDYYSASPCRPPIVTAPALLLVIIVVTYMFYRLCGREAREDKRE